MKKISYLLLSLLLAGGCNFLDFDETSGVYSRDDMYETYDYVNRMLTNIYSYLPQDLASMGSGAMRECGVDDAECANPDASIQIVNNGNWSPTNTFDTRWDLYKGIRSANEFLESVVKVDLSKYSTETKYKQWIAHLEIMPYECRLLRAYYFFELARRYGDIPMPLKMLSIDEANSIEKTPFDDVIDFIVEECDTCARHLPDNYKSIGSYDYGRVTKGFALAVKSKSLLYAASALHNPTGDKQKWARAAQAALDLIEYAPSANIRLSSAEKANTIENPEVILCRQNDASASIERYNFPLRFTQGDRTSMGGTYPTQNLVDAFQTLDGYDITLEADGWKTLDPNFDITKPYEGRDPRFERAILADGMIFKGQTIETFVGGADYAATRNDLNSITGYYMRKYLNAGTDFTPEHEVSDKHQWVIYRFAETLLTYAECVNEYFGDPVSHDATFYMSALEAINEVRANAGMPDVTAATYDAFTKALRREWRVEFAFEDHRYWDVRRWKIGSSTTQIDGVNIQVVGDKKEYSRKLIEHRTWADKMNLYPIPQSELFNNPNLNPQNQGW